MSSTMRWAGLSLAIGLMGCTNAFDQIESQGAEYIRLDCQCRWMEDGHASEDECIRDQLPLVGGFDACERRAYAEVAAYPPYFECLIPVNQTLLDCLRAAGCDTAAETACFEASTMEAERCPEPSDADVARAETILAECRIGPPGRCPDATISGSSGVIASGTTLGAGADLTGSCGGAEAPDRAFTWTAPSSGVWTFDTNGSDYDTLLYAVMSCGGAELACDDDDGEGLRSQITLTLTAGQTIVLVVDGFSDRAGDFVLNVTGG